MTTIAFDGISVASDSLQGSHDYDCPVPAVKLVEKNGVVYAICGFFAWFDAWIKWYEAGADPKETPICKAPNNNTTFIVFEKGRCFTYDSDMPYPDEAFAGEAFGSGRGFAMGAMAFGANARQAVETAIKLDPGSGGPVQVIDLESLKAKAAA
jgi:hypothetical protein